MNLTRCTLIALLTISLLGCGDSDTSNSDANNTDVEPFSCEPLPESELEDCAIEAGEIVVGSRYLRTKEHLQKVCQSSCSRFDEGIVLEVLPGVTDLKAMQNVRSIPGGVYIERTEDLKSLEGLENTEFQWESKKFPGVNISDNKSLETLEGLNLPAVLDSSGYKGSGLSPSISIAGNPSLTSLKGLEQIEETRYMAWRIRANVSLTSLDGLQNLKHNKGTVGITIQNNPGLESIRLDSLESAVALNIFSNNNLTTLELPSLETIDYFIVQDNESLPACQVDQIASRIDVGERQQNTGNDFMAMCE